jgi:hypothetical protein
MKYLFNLIEYLESNHRYAQADEMIKLALDMTDVLKEENELGNGSYGQFFSDFDQDQKRKLKDQLGNIPDNVGIKLFKEKQYNPMSGIIANLTENLTFIYIAPYINQKTDLITPVYTGSLPLSAMITNKINITQKMSGETLWAINAELEKRFGAPGWASFNAMEYSIEAKIKKKLDVIGVDWADCHAGNYLINKQVAQEFLKWANNNPINNNMTFDLSRNASLFDFGQFTVEAGTLPGQQLIKLKQQMKSRPDNKFAQVIIKAIEEVVK